MAKKTTRVYLSDKESVDLLKSALEQTLERLVAVNERGWYSGEWHKSFRKAIGQARSALRATKGLLAG